MSRFAAFACLALVTLIANSNGRLLAEEPQRVIRTFIVFGDVDFTSEDSVLVKVGWGDAIPRIMHLNTENTDPDSVLNNSIWAIGSPSAMYITRGDGDTPIGSFSWLIVDPETPDLPPNGSVTLTGPDALLVQEHVFFFASGNYLYTTNNEHDSIMTIVTAVFSR